MSEENPSNSSHKICELCNEKGSKYCCPRCDILYCSLDCYKSEKHATCSEDFYRDCISEELASYQADDDSKQKMIDILKKMQTENGGGIDELLEEIENDENTENVDSDDGDEIDLHERIKDLNLNDADAVWEALTEDERNEFRAMLSQGDVGSIMPQWEPWWMFRKEKKLVDDGSENSREALQLKQCPVLKKVPDMSTITKVEPSKAICYNITNVLACYAFIMRYFNGEVEAMEWVIYFLSICANLDTNTNYDEPSLAVESVVQNCLQSQLIQTDKESLDVMRYDTFLILQGPSEENSKYYCQAALSHLHKILTHAKNAVKTKDTAKVSKITKEKTFSQKFPDHESKDLPPLDISKVKKCIKKLEYYLSYVQSRGIDFDK